MVGVAAGGEVGGAVDEVAGESNAGARFEAEDVVLAAGAGGLLAFVRELCGLSRIRGMLTVTWSIQIRSAPAKERASPPQTYLWFRSLTWMFWTMTFLPAKERPLPLMMPLAPMPRMVLLEPTLMGFFAAL